MNRRRTIFVSIIVMIALFIIYCGTSVAIVSTSEYTNYEYYHDPAHAGKILVNGIDVSSYQGDIDWHKVKAAGIDFAIIRIGGRGYGYGDLYEDTCYRDNIVGAKEAGLMVGVYFFSQAISKDEVTEELDYMMGILNGEELDLPIYMDYEYSGDEEGRLELAQLSKLKATALVKEFLTGIEAKGYKAGFYSNTRFLKDTVYGSILGDYYTMWTAQYNDFCQYDEDFQMWQYTSNGRVDGIEGAVDCNFMYVDKKAVKSSEKSIVDCTVTADNSPSKYVYEDGKSYSPEISLSDQLNYLTEGVDYKVGYINNSKPGTAYAMITGIGEYTDYVLIPFNINPKLETGATISGTIEYLGVEAENEVVIQLMPEYSTRSWFEEYMAPGTRFFKFENIPGGKYVIKAIGKDMVSREEIIEVPKTEDENGNAQGDALTENITGNTGEESAPEGTETKPKKPFVPQVVNVQLKVFPLGDTDFDGKVNSTQGSVISERIVTRIPISEKMNFRIDWEEKQQQ